MPPGDTIPSSIVQMIATGEESGQLDVVLAKSSEGLDRDIDHTVKRLIARLEPTFTVVLAFIVGFILLAVYLPMFDVMGMIAK